MKIRTQALAVILIALAFIANIAQSAEISGKVRVAGLTTENIIRRNSHPSGVYRIGLAGELADCVVFLSDGLDNRTFSAASNNVVVKLTPLGIEPRVIAGMAGSSLTIRNDDSKIREVEFSAQDGQKRSERLLPEKASRAFPLAKPVLFMRVIADKERATVAYVSVFDHPFFAVTDGEGAFAFRGDLPDGTYGLTAAHKVLGIGSGVLKIKDGKGEVDIVIDTAKRSFAPIEPPNPRGRGGI